MMSAAVKNRPALAIVAAIFLLFSPTRPCLALVYCAIHPVSPLCCPSPCPVEDIAKIADFLDEARQAWQAVQQVEGIGQQFAGITRLVGQVGAGSPYSGIDSLAWDNGQVFMPSWLVSAGTTDLAGIRSQILNSMFGASSGLSDRQQQAQRVSATAVGAAADAVAIGFSAPAAQLAEASATARNGQSAAASTDNRADWTQNSAARQDLLAQFDEFSSMLALWLATGTTQAATGGQFASGSTTQGEATPPLVAPPATDAGQSALTQAGMTAWALTLLHNERQSANLLASQTPGLQRTVDSHQLALGMLADDSKAVGGLLAALFVNGPEAFARISPRLMAMDHTAWTDGAAKTKAASLASTAMVVAIVTDPSPYGPIHASDVALTAESAARLRDAFAAWLEDTKLERFWRPLRQEADATLAKVNDRLSISSARLGANAAARESAALADLSRQVQAMGEVRCDGCATRLSAIRRVLDVLSSDRTARFLVDAEGLP
jgi:hypothetical protein